MVPSTDWRNGSASDSSPEGYAFESRIGHCSQVYVLHGTPTGTQFTFDPPLKYGEDVLVTVFNRTHALVRLRHGKAWGPEGPLKITAVQTGPMGPFLDLRPRRHRRDTPASRRYHTKLSEEERKDKCAPCRAALLTVTNRDSATMDEAEQALGLKASKD